LLVIGRQMGRNDDTSTNSLTTNAMAVADAVEEFAQRGKPVMYVHYSRDATDLTKALFSRVLNIDPDVANNYWVQAGLQNFTHAQAAATMDPPIMALKRAIDSVFDGASNASGMALTENEYLPCFGSQNTWWSATCTAGFDYKVREAVKTMRNYVRGLDQSAVDLFPVDDPLRLYTPREMRVAVLLGDKARERIQYPFNRTDRFAFVNAMFGDAAVLYRRSRGPAQPNLGEL
jgi:immunomodulating metalloprotease